MYIINIEMKNFDMTKKSKLTSFIIRMFANGVGRKTEMEDGFYIEQGDESSLGLFYMGDLYADIILETPPAFDLMSMLDEYADDITVEEFEESEHDLEDIAIGLFTLLDNIDTINDMAKDNDKLFRLLAMQEVNRRIDYGNTDGFNIKWN